MTVELIVRLARENPRWGYLRIAGITSNPLASWVTQQARNLSMELAAKATALECLIRDRDAKYPASFDAVFAAANTRATPRRSGLAG